MRPLLHAVPGGGFREMPESDACCGGGGSYALTHPEHANAVFDRKYASIVSSGAETVTTICPVCLLQLQRGLRERGSGIRAMHFLELAWQAVAVGESTATPSETPVAHIGGQTP